MCVCLCPYVSVPALASDLLLIQTCFRSDVENLAKRQGRLHLPLVQETVQAQDLRVHPPEERLRKDSPVLLLHLRLLLQIPSRATETQTLPDPQTKRTGLGDVERENQ